MPGATWDMLEAVQETGVVGKQLRGLETNKPNMYNFYFSSATSTSVARVEGGVSRSVTRVNQH